jgi:hypothetical protein
VEGARLAFSPRETRTEILMQDTTNANEGRHIPFKQEGWGVALFVVFLAVASAAGATYVHKTTYKHPTDVRFHAAGTTGSNATAGH